MSVCSEESETPSIDHKFISKEELELLNTKVIYVLFSVKILCNALKGKNIQKPIYFLI